MTIYPFTPGPLGPFQFQPTLDGSQYTAVVTWGLADERYYINLYTLGGVRVLTLPVIGSVDAVAVEAASWSHGIVTVTTALPHGYLLGTTANLTVSGMSPVAYNGEVKGFITRRNEFQYPLAADPGAAQQLGASNYDINIVAGYFASKLVYRTGSTQFEVSP